VTELLSKVLVPNIGRYHLGLSNAHFKNEGLSYRNLDKTSIGIEIIGWGWVTKKGGKFLTYVNSEVDPDEVITL
jgi:hypothetical protein